MLALPYGPASHTCYTPPSNHHNVGKDIEMRLALLLLFSLVAGSVIPFQQSAQNQNPRPPDTVYLLKPAHIFVGDSSQWHDNWVVLVRGEKIAAVGPINEVKAPPEAKVIDLRGLTLM